MIRIGSILLVIFLLITAATSAKDDDLFEALIRGEEITLDWGDGVVFVPGKSALEITAPSAAEILRQFVIKFSISDETKWAMDYVLLNILLISTNESEVNGITDSGLAATSAQWDAYNRVLTLKTSQYLSARSEDGQLAYCGEELVGILKIEVNINCVSPEQEDAGSDVMVTEIVYRDGIFTIVYLPPD